MAELTPEAQAVLDAACKCVDLNRAADYELNTEEIYLEAAVDAYRASIKPAESTAKE